MVLNNKLIKIDLYNVFIIFQIKLDRYFLKQKIEYVLYKSKYFYYEYTRKEKKADLLTGPESK